MHRVVLVIAKTWWDQLADMLTGGGTPVNESQVKGGTLVNAAGVCILACTFTRQTGSAVPAYQRNNIQEGLLWSTYSHVFGKNTL